MSIVTLKHQPQVVDLDRPIRRGKAVLRELATAKKRNAGKPGTSLRHAAKELGL